MKRLAMLLACLTMVLTMGAASFPEVTETPLPGAFPLATAGGTATICTDAGDHAVVTIAARMLADDVQRVTGRRPELSHKVTPAAAVVAGTLGKSRLTDQLVKRLNVDVSQLRGRWESFVITTAEHPTFHTPLLLIVGSDRRGTAYGLTSLSEAMGVSPWYWWADITPRHKEALYVAPGSYRQREPDVQYRGIFINDERFGGWARWAEQHYEKETGKVGPKTYEKVFELLLRLKANYLWPAMHPGTQAFNDDPENARLADRYAIVMGSSHCEQMLRNNEGEWKAVNERAQRQARLNAVEREQAGAKSKAVNERAKAEGKVGLGDFNYITNRRTMQDYWETRVKTNGRYENTYTLGLRGVHDYPMEGANSTQERVALMQQAIDDQRRMLQRNIRRPLEQIPQVLCTYEEVLEAYHNGLQVPDDVTLLWSDDKHGYCRNLSNPQEQRRKGGAGIYYHLSYHGDPASWIWLSPLSPAFLSTELTKAYAFGARKIWVFNVGDIKPAEKELSFVMELAWDLRRWQPTEAHKYIEHWTAKTFGPEVAQPVADLMARYYRLQAAGKDAHVWFVDYTEQQVADRLRQARSLETEAELLGRRLPDRWQDAYFELVSYPVRGAAMLNEYQLLARRSMACAARGDSLGAMADAERVEQLFSQLNEWTRHYNDDVAQGKWRHFFSWQPYHWYRSERIDPPIATPALLAQARRGPTPRHLPMAEALTPAGTSIVSRHEADIPLWIKALTPVRNFSKAPEDNVFCQVTTDSGTFQASATPINNVWHAPYVGPMWSRVGTLHLKQGRNRIAIGNVKDGTRIDDIYVGLWPPFAAEPRQRISATACRQRHDTAQGHLTTVAGLGYTDALMVQPFDTPSCQPAQAPCAEYVIDLTGEEQTIEIRTLPTLHVYEGRDARYAVQLDDQEPQVFSIHAQDFTAEWRCNVLRGYASRTVAIPPGTKGPRRLRISLLDPGIVLQELLVY